nr:LLM class flavin-dependent oxidoreductase [Sphingomonas sp. CDS-1]
MKFGVFLPTASNGFLMSRNAPQYDPSYSNILEISREAERIGMDFVLALTKYRGFGGATDYWKACLESLTLMSAIGASTSRIEIFPTTSIISIHPAIMARMVATIDQVTGGRCGLNIVSGWNQPEFAQMGMWPGDDHFQDRYAFAAEYTEVMQRLWEQGRASYEGKYFQLDDCTAYPRPSRKIPLVCAGSSPKGLEFTARYGDYSFVNGSDPAKIAALVRKIRGMGEELGRKVGCYAGFGLIVADTDEEAQAIYDDIETGLDLEAIANMVGNASKDTNAGGSSQELSAAGQAMITKGQLSAMSPMIVGSPRTVAERIDELVDATGIDGMLLSWPDFMVGLKYFGEEIMPRLRCKAAVA